MAQAHTSRSRRAKLGIAAGAVTLALAPALLAPGIASAQDTVDTGSVEDVLGPLLENISLADVLELLATGSSGTGETPQ
ncbi:hypothetical protein [Millisia brevis]|uniref:hypothetical protein n=1 Tax=Millisia brevis TaxID=264148 RepID=UPI00082AD339|nr:hypothetical protein [Millisia brevis]